MTLELRQIRHTYPDGDRTLVALDSVDFRAAAGEFVTLTGPSGSGKSTLLAVAGGLASPESGRVLIDGTDLTELTARQRDALRAQRIGFVFQQSNLLGSLNAVDQLRLAAHVAGLPLRRAGARARDLLDRVGLSAKAERRPHQLSGGERQRVGIARALMGEPALLLVDEPTSALDHERGAAVVRLLRDLTHEAGLATVMVTHDLQYLDLADRSVRMADGRLFSEPSARTGR